MKLLTATLSLLAAGLLSTSLATAAPVTATVTHVGANGTVNRTTENTFLATLSGAVTETFENIVLGTQGSTIGSSVGSFTMVTPGSGGQCSPTCGAGLKILNAATSPFSGRFNTTVGGSQWLDSWDAMQFAFAPGAGINRLGFYITDPNDAGGRFDFETVSGLHTIEFDKIFGNVGLPSGRAYYLTFTSTEAISGLRILSNDRDDGFGIDDVTVGRVPEPGVLALLGLGLIGVAAVRRQRRV